MLNVTRQALLMVTLTAGALGLVLVASGAALAQSEGAISGDLKRWHPVTITFDGPTVSETDASNPFRGYRLNVTFRHESGRQAYVVPGYFAADGDAAETGASSGNKWRVHFTPHLSAGAVAWRSSDCGVREQRSKASVNVA